MPARAIVINFLILLLSIQSTNLYSQNTPTVSLSKRNARNFVAKEVVGNDSTLLSTHFKQWKVIQLSSAELSATLKSNGFAEKHIGLQLSKEIGFNLALEPSNIVAAKYKLTIQTPEGIKTSNLQLNYLYKGKVTDKDGGDVRVTIKDGYIYGSVMKGEKEYFIEPVNRYDKGAKKDQFIFYESADVISTTMPCGYNDANEASARAMQQQSKVSEISRPDGTQSGICKKVKFLIATDYSMYKSFNNDIDALQAFLLSNINMAEGLFNTLNLGTDNTTDVGTDFLEFEVTRIHTSVCDSCDFMDNSDDTYNIGRGFNKWLQENTNIEDAYINEFWSTRNLYVSGLGNIVGLSGSFAFSGGCSHYTNLLKYYSQDARVLRLEVAHEAGHALGCDHDDGRNPSVRDFIMNANANINATRFSRLSDFGGMNYSSQLAMRNTLHQSTCFGDCVPPSCETVTGLKINYYNSPDSIKLSWAGSGNFKVKYKIKDSVNFNPLQTFVVTGHELVIKNISSCALYIAEVQKICANNEPGSTSSITLNVSPFSVNAVPANIRGDVYDLQLQLNCKACIEKVVIVNIDQHPYRFVVKQFPATVVISNLFADGARHRIDYNGDSVNNGCKILKFYQAPYYRDNSIKILNERFDSCKIPSGWKDTALRVVNNSATGTWYSANIVRGINAWDDFYFLPGNLNSTCMAFSTNGNGSHALVIPAINLTKYKNVYLSFDYKYIAYRMSIFPNQLNAFFKVQVFNGKIWEDVFELNQQESNYKPNRRNIWDTISPRVFVNLDKYRNDNFQVRFVVDDGAVINPITNKIEWARVFPYIDNIKIDGYDIANNVGENSFSIFPNPASNEIFVKMDPLLSVNMQYKVFDVLGRLIQQEKLENYRINVNKLSSTTYFLSLYKSNQQFGKTLKFIKL